MPKRKIPHPTAAELDILNVLWENGPSTVRQVNEIINRKKATGYTTTLKFMQIMIEKGILVRDASQVRHVYRPAISEAKTQKQLVENLLNKAFSGSAEKLVMRALSAKRIIPEELGRIREMIDEMGEESE